MPPCLSVFKDPESEAQYITAYDNILARWPVPYQPIDISTRFGQTHINVSGSSKAPPLMLLHGNFASSTMWLSNIAHLSQSYCVYAVDTIGEVGKSVPLRIPASRTDYAEWLCDLLEQLKIEKTDFLGMSYGGFLSVNFALHFPQRVNRLVLLCPGLPLAPFTIQWAIRGTPMLISSAHWAGEWFLAGASLRYRHKDNIQETFIIGAMSARSKFVLRPEIQKAEWAQLKMPILLLVGDHEILYDPQIALERAKQLMPHIETELIVGAGHLLNYDQPERVDESILRFLEKTG